ncbi:MAG: hypothetical protein DCC66_02595 [Planctomycetota bacterium]|nr:MAG: hypothetical protein DCC66_02595 [Planctomycetota bacterium]
MLSVSAVLLSGYQAAGERQRAEDLRRKALSIRAEYESLQRGVKSSVDLSSDTDHLDANKNIESVNVPIDETELVVNVGSVPDVAAKSPAAPKPPRQPESRVAAQVNAFGALALVMLALLGAALAMGLFHADPSTKNWIGAMTLASLIGLALAWRGVIPPNYVGRSAIIALFVLMAYGFIDARRRGRYTWPVRIGVVAAFIAVCCVLSWYGRAV